LSELSKNDYPLYDSGKIFKKYNLEKKLDLFLDLAIDFNRKVNIVSRETSREDLIRIVADCLVPLEFGLDIKGKVFDIGPGGGFPSIVLMLVRPDIEATLIERTGKKADFLGRIIRQFNLRAVVYNKNFSEVVGQLPRESFDFGFMKYVNLDRKILYKAFSLLKADGRFIYYSALNANQGFDNGIYKVRETRYLNDNKQLRTITIFSK
jgi:16S rRNA (guanine527-N7)-methyltransferase